MRAMRRAFAIISFLFRNRAERELAREIQSHLALAQEEFERRGMQADEARLAARRALGGVEQAKELHREERSIVWLEQALQDLRHACRGLARGPGFTLAAVLTLALGIGVNTTFFSLFNAVTLKPLPVADPDRVVRFERWFETGSLGNIQYGFSYPEYVYSRDNGTQFSSLVAASWLFGALEAHSDSFRKAGSPACIGELLRRPRNQPASGSRLPAGRGPENRRERGCRAQLPVLAARIPR